MTKPTNARKLSLKKFGDPTFRRFLVAGGLAYFIHLALEVSIVLAPIGVVSLSVPIMILLTRNFVFLTS